jgi:hypothetical protein
LKQGLKDQKLSLNYALFGKVLKTRYPNIAHISNFEI